MNFTNSKDFIDFVKEKISNKSLILPTLPDVALKVRELTLTEGVSCKELSNIIITDPALSAKFIQISNSPLYLGVSRIDDIQTAVSRLGVNSVKNIVNSIVMKQMFAPTTELTNAYFTEIWQDSISVSAISRSLSTLIPHLNPDEAMLAGLIHQIGKLPILTVAEDLPDFINNPPRLRKLLEKTHSVVGGLIMDSWDFPEQLKKVPSEYNLLSRSHSEKADYVDIVQVSFLQNKVIKNIDYSKIDSFQKVGLSSFEDLNNEEIILTKDLLGRI